jgi:tetratricopeptide (TPR) repeat protein
MANELDRAWELAKELIVEKPDSAQALFVAARILAQRKNLDGAIQMISKIDPDDPEAGMAAVGQMAEWLSQSGNLSEAESKAKQVLKGYPTAVPALRLLIDIYHAQGRRWDAYRVLERLVRLGDFSTVDLMNSIDPREPVDMPTLRDAAKRAMPDAPYNRFADLRILSGANRWSDAVDGLKDLVATHPELLEPWVWYGEALIETDRWADIPQWLTVRPSGYENHPEYWYVLGRIQEHQRAIPEAARCYIESLRRDRRHVPAMQSLSEVLMEMEQPEMASQVRSEAGKLVRIKDLFQQIQRGLGKRDEVIEIANTYRALGDPLAAFAWDVIHLINEQKPIPQEWVDTQKSLRTGPRVESQLLANLPIDSWPLPDSNRHASPATQERDAERTDTVPIRMTDVAVPRGMDIRYVNGAESGRGWTTIEGLGGGVSALDYDRDGWTDFFFSQAGDNPLKDSPEYQPKSLFRSIGSIRFVDVATPANVAGRGYGQGTGVADVDQDGFDDLLVADMGQISVWRNQGDGTFESIAVPQAPPPAFWNSSIQAADLNGDSLPDIVQGAYIHGEDVFTRRCPSAQNESLIFCHPKRFEPGKSRIMFNRGDGSWELAPADILDSLVDGYALGSLITDLDGLGGNDVFFANDVSPNHLLLSQREDQTLTLREVAMKAGVAVDALGRSQASMGIACGDQNRDGLLDLIVTNFRYEDSTLYLQVSPGLFIDGTRTSRLGESTREWLSFGCQLADMDNDGWLDFITVNGHIDYLTPWQMPPQVLANRKGKFEWLRNPSPGAYFDVDNVGRSLTMTDFDRDGRLDFVVTHLDRPAALLHNDSPASDHAFIQIELIGVESQREAIGTRIAIQAGDERWVASLSVGDGFYGTNERIVHIGLGPLTSIDSIELVWPSGRRETYRDIEPRRRYRAIESLGLEMVDR